MKELNEIQLDTHLLNLACNIFSEKIISVYQFFYSPLYLFKKGNQ